MLAVSRRSFLLLSSLLMLRGVAHAASGEPSHRFHGYPFRLGVASGSPRHDSVVIWTRLLDESLRQAVNVHWEVAEDEHFGRIVQSGIASALPELAHSVHAEVYGLEADHWYWYRFRAGDVWSPVGRTRTFPLPHVLVEQLRFAYASCQRWESGYYSAYRHMAGENLDCVVFLGDYIYEGKSIGGGVRHHRLMKPYSLSDYRQRYELYKSDSDLQRMHATCPWIVTWDDHEVLNNYVGQESGGGDKGFLAIRTAAYQAYYEHMPLRRSTLLHGIAGIGRPDALRIYDRYRYGRLATFHILDSRQYRDRPLCGKKQSKYCAEQDDSRRTYLGAEQEQWFDESLRMSADSDVRWDVIGSQTVFTSRMNQRLKEGQQISSGTWSGYRGAQNRMIDSITRNKVQNAIFVGGDIHQNRVVNVHRDIGDPKSPIIASEFCGTSITSRAGRSQAEINKMAKKNPHWIFANSEKRGYGVVEITPKQCEVTLRAVHDVRDKDSGIETLAKFVVEDGKPGIRRLS